MAECRPLNEQFGLNVASSMAIVESKLLHVNRISVSWHPHSSTTSANMRKVSMSIFGLNILIAITASPKNSLMEMNVSVTSFPYLTNANEEIETVRKSDEGTQNDIN